MRSLSLQVPDEIYDKLIWFIQTLSPQGVQILDDSYFDYVDEKTAQIVERDIEDYKLGKNHDNFISFEEVKR